MKKRKIGINGFGRIGRLALRESFKYDSIEIVAINDLASIEELAYLLKYDSAHGRFDKEVEVLDGNLVVNGKTIRVTSERDPLNINWSDTEVELVLDCTGIFKEIDSASKHLEAGAKKVVISAPSKTAPMFVMGVNHEKMKAEDVIISNASCTTNCLAPMAKIINDKFGLAEGLMTTVHSATASQTTVDLSNAKNYRIGRSALNNIIPSTTGAAIAVTKVIPELEGKLTGMAFRVPVVNVSVVDLTLRTEKETSLEEIKQAFLEASQNEYKGIVAYVDEPLVSHDFMSNDYICNFDAGASIELNSRFFKLVAWYDNEYGYAAKLLDLANHALSL